MRVIAGLCSKLVISREFSATNRKMTSTFVHSFEKRTDEHKFSAFDVGYGIYLAPEAGFLSIFSPVVRTREKNKICLSHSWNNDWVYSISTPTVQTVHAIWGTVLVF